MNTIQRAAVAASSTLLLAACASSGSMVSSPPAAQPRHAPGQVVQDAEYVAIVERIARRRGVDVRWINPPVKRVAASEAEPGNQ